MAQLITRHGYQDDDLTWLQTIWGKPVQRFFWIDRVPANGSRGGHRHPSCQMVLHCPLGSVSVYVQTPQEDHWYTLSDSSQYLLLAPEDWRLMYEFSANAVLVVLAEKSYALTAYINPPYRPVSINQRPVP